MKNSRLRFFIIGFILITISFILATMIGCSSPVEYSQLHIPKVVEFYASSTNVVSGEAVTLYWGIVNADEVIVTSGVLKENVVFHSTYSAKRINGSCVIYPTETECYTLKVVKNVLDFDQKQIFINVKY